MRAHVRGASREQLRSSDPLNLKLEVAGELAIGKKPRNRLDELADSQATDESLRSLPGVVRQMPNQALAMLKAVCRVPPSASHCKLFRVGVWAFRIKISWQRGTEKCEFASAVLGTWDLPAACLSQVITLAAKDSPNRLSLAVSCLIRASEGAREAPGGLGGAFGERKNRIEYTAIMKY